MVEDFHDGIWPDDSSARLTTQLSGRSFSASVAKTDAKGIVIEKRAHPSFEADMEAATRWKYEVSTKPTIRAR